MVGNEMMKMHMISMPPQPNLNAKEIIMTMRYYTAAD